MVIGGYMKFIIDNQEYKIEVLRKATNKNTYIRVKKDLTITVTTNFFTSNRDIAKLIEENKMSLLRMISQAKVKNESNEGFNYLGKKYDIVYVGYCDISFGQEKVFLNKNIDIDKWYKKQAKKIFKEHLDKLYNLYTEQIPYPDLRIRKMTTRWGVCNTKTKVITLNLELIKRDLKYLDYVIVHELSHLIEANHSSKFWLLVEKNYKDYKICRKEMKDF